LKQAQRDRLENDGDKERPGDETADDADGDVHESEPAQSRAREYYSKFDGGFVGHFADISAFHGGLDQMIGECRKDISKAIEEEHTAVRSGFGASNEPFITPNYNIMTTVAREFNFCSLGERDSPPLYDKKRVEIKMGQETTPRQAKDVRALHKNAAALITESFEKSKHELGFDSSVTVTEEKMATEIQLLLEEVCDAACLIYSHVMALLYQVPGMTFLSQPGPWSPSLHWSHAGLYIGLAPIYKWG
jgi:hypothetical protein